MESESVNPALLPRRSLGIASPKVPDIKLSVIVPVFNEALVIVQTLEPLQKWRALGIEVIVVDGGSGDQTAHLAKPLVDLYLYSDAGRAIQMNTGAAEASGDFLMFLHADTVLPNTFLNVLPATLDNSVHWGFFPVRLSGRHWLLRCIERGMNMRSRLTGVATGDQAMWLSMTLWRQAGGFKNIPLMEDVELSKRLRRVVWPSVARQTLCTSSRRWESHGVIRTIILMWRLRLLYFFGVSPKKLASFYREQSST